MVPTYYLSDAYMLTTLFPKEGLDVNSAQTEPELFTLQFDWCYKSYISFQKYIGTSLILGAILVKTTSCA